MAAAWSLTFRGGLWEGVCHGAAGQGGQGLGRPAIDILQEMARGRLKHPRQPNDGAQSDVSLAPFHRADVGAVETALAGKGLLRESHADPESAHLATENHGGSVVHKGNHCPQ